MVDFFYICSGLKTQYGSNTILYFTMKNDICYNKYQLYWMMCLFAVGEIETELFYDKFYLLYSQNNKACFSEDEINILTEFTRNYIDRYTPYISDRKDYPNYFIDEDELVRGVKATIGKISIYMDVIKDDIDVIKSLITARDIITDCCR